MLQLATRRSARCVERLLLITLLALAASVAQAQFTVTSTVPAPNAASASRTAPFELQFSQPVDPATWGGITVFASSKHAINTKGAGGNSGRVLLTPASPLQAGEIVSVVVPASVRSLGGSTGGSPATPSVTQFRAAAGGSRAQRLFVRFQPDQRVGKVSDATLGDVDNDGDLDALAADPTAGRIAVMLNDGTGHLIPDVTRRFNVVTGLTTVRCADVDNDGDLDVLSCAVSTRAVRLCLNDGTGHFGTPVVIGSAWLGPMDLCVGDMNADGYLDVTVCDALSNTVTTCLNNGSGSFPAGSFVSITCAGAPVSLSCDDMDNDGDLDVVASCRDTGEIAILLWQLSQWTAGLRTALPAGSGPAGVVTGDFSGDGRCDLAVACAGSTSGGVSVASAVRVLTQSSTGTFSVSQTLSCCALSLTVSCADIDGDGDLDLLCPNAAGASVVSCLNNGPATPGTFTNGATAAARYGSAPAGGVLFVYGDAVARVCPADLDGDGDIDAIAVCTGSGDVATMTNQVMPRYVATSPAPGAVVARTTHTVSVTCDGPLDASNLPQANVRCDWRGNYTPLTPNAPSSGSAVMSYSWGASNSGSDRGYAAGGLSQGRLLPPVQWSFDKRPDPSDGTLVAQSGTPLSIDAGAVMSVADFNGDGRNDVAYSNPLFDIKTQYRTSSNGWSAPIVTHDPTAPAGYTPSFVRCTDVNGDGTADLIVVADNGTDSYWAVYTCNSVTLNFTKVKFDYFTGRATDLILGDSDNDGVIESIMPTPSNHAINTKGCGSNARSSSTSLSVTDSPSVVAFVPGGLSGEAHLIVAGTSSGGPYVQRIAVDEAGDLHPDESPKATLTAAVGSNLVAADLDGDGLAEAIVPTPSAHAINTKGAGSNAGRVVSTGTNSPTYVCVGDLDGDGDRDLVAVCPGTSVLWVGLNDGSGGFGSSYTVAVGAVPVQAWLGDCDNDGQADVLVRCTDNTVRLFRVGPPSPLDLFISTTTTIPSGTYHNITILDGGDATASSGSAGSVTCTGQLMVSSGGALSGPMLFGPGATFGVQPGATLHISDPAGVSADGLTGQFRYAVPPTVPTPLFGVSLNFTKIVFDFKPQSTNSVTQPQVTGTGLPPQVWDLTVGDNLTLTNPTTITGRVTVKPGCILRPTIPTAQLRLRSVPDSVALVVNEGSGVILGDVTVETYVPSNTIPGGDISYRHLGVATSNAIVASLGTSSAVPVVNAAVNTSPTPTYERPFPTVFYYDQSRLATAVNNLGTFDKGWASPAALSDALPPGRGYTVNLPGTSTLTCTGPLNNGDITLNLSRNSGTTAADAGWALVCNLYPSPLDWSLVDPTDRPSLDASIYVFESVTRYTGRYLTYVNGVGNLDPALAMSQGFWVRVSQGNTSGSLLLHNRQRLTERKKEEIIPHRSATAPRPTLHLALAPETNPTGQTDPLYLYLQAGATAGLDPEYDAAKLPNSSGLNLSALASTGEALSIQGLPALGNGSTVVPLTLGLPAAGRYVLATEQLADFAPGTRLVLRDVLLNTSTPLTVGSRYAFASPATTVAGRFFLDLAPAAAPLASAAQLLDAGLSIFPNPARTTATLALPGVPNATQATIGLSDALGREVRHLRVPLPATGQQATLDLTGLAPGLYAVRVRVGNATALRRLVVE